MKKDGVIGFLESRDGVKDPAKLQSLVLTVLFSVDVLASIAAWLFIDKAPDYELLLILGGLAFGNSTISRLMEGSERKNEIRAQGAK